MINIDENFIKKATEKALGFDDISRNTKKEEWFEARVVYYKACKVLLPEVSPRRVGIPVKRDRCTVLHGLKQFDNIKSCKIKYEIVIRFIHKSLPEHTEEISDSVLKLKVEALMEKIQYIKLEHQAQLQRLNDAFLSQLAELSPQQYTEFKERAEVILKMLKNKVTYQTISRDNFNCKKESLKIDLI